MKKRARAKKSRAKTPPPPRMLKQAVPPPDNPLLRYEADRAAQGSGPDDKQRAQARAKALRQTQEMRAADPTDTAPNSNARRPG